MTTPSPRASARATSKREQILEGAQRLFLAHGYSGTSTSAIARATGVSKETLYAYYPTKEALFAAVLHHLSDKMSESHFNEVPPDMLATREAFEEALRGVAQRMLLSTMRPDYLALIRLVLSESINVPQLGGLFRSSLPLRGLADLSLLLEQARERKLIQVEDVEVASRMFIGSLLTYILFDGLMRTDEAPLPPDQARIERGVRLFCHALFPDVDQNK